MSELRFNPDIQAFARIDSRTSPEDIRPPHGSGKLYQLANNENPLGPSPRVIETINELAPTLSYYPDFSDIELRRAISKVLGREVTPDLIFTGCSGFESLELIARAFLGPGDELILSSPTFSGAYKKIAEPLGAKVIDVPLTPETFAWRPDAVLEAVNDRTKLVMLCNPNNPTGTVISADAMDQLMSGLPDHVLVVADEVYHHFVEDPTFPDSLRYVLENRNIVIVHSFSKAYGLAGLRLGYGIAEPEIANYIAGLHRGFHQNKLALAAGIAACQDQAHVRRIASNSCAAKRAGSVSSFDRLDITVLDAGGELYPFRNKDDRGRAESETAGTWLSPAHANAKQHAIRRPRERRHSRSQSSFHRRAGTDPWRQRDLSRSPCHKAWAEVKPNIVLSLRL